MVAHSYYLAHDPKQTARMRPYPPLATLLAASLLRERGMAVRLFDAMLSEGVHEFELALDAEAPAIVGIIEDNFNFLTKMCTTRMREATLAMIRAAKDRGCRVAVNGSDATDQPATYLAAGADAVITGEAEHTFAELVAAWQRDSAARLDDIPGLRLGTPMNGGVHATPARPFLDDLDALPFPAWDLVDVARYRSAWGSAHGRLSWNVVASRGCPYHCNWCAKPVFGTRYAQRTPENVAEELAQLRATVAPDHVWFADDIFGLTAPWITRFADEVRRRDARIPFMMQSRVNLMRPPVVAALATAGCEEVWLGVESGAQHILDGMDKGTRLNQVRAATRTLRGAGIHTGWFIQLGYLGEDWADILRTRDLVREERPDDIGVSVAYPLPGTGFYERVRTQLGTKRHWEDSGDLAMMFRGTYTTPFYREVRDLLHDEVAAGGTQDLDDRWAALAHREPDARTTTTATTA
ncbi:MAG: radical SAM protein [Gemmatimonadales bacterium]